MDGPTPDFDPGDQSFLNILRKVLHLNLSNVTQILCIMWTSDMEELLVHQGQLTNAKGYLELLPEVVWMKQVAVY